MAETKYRPLTEDEKEVFRSACKRLGIKPTEKCPLCAYSRIKTELQYRYDDKTQAWVSSSVKVRCHTCKVEYRVSVEAKS